MYVLNTFYTTTVLPNRIVFIDIKIQTCGKPPHLPILVQYQQKTLHQILSMVET